MYYVRDLDNLVELQACVRAHICIQSRVMRQSAAIMRAAEENPRWAALYLYDIDQAYELAASLFDEDAVEGLYDHMWENVNGTHEWELRWEVWGDVETMIRWSAKQED